MTFTDKYGHKRRGKIYVCQTCGLEFVERLVSDTRPQPKYCSHNCSNIGRRNRIVVVCDNCGKPFSRTPNKLKNSKHGKTFCSRRCKDYAQSFLGSCSDIHPRHYNPVSPSNYRDIAYRMLPNQCSDCGVKHRYMLVVHHIDGDKNNNNIANLEILCHNHHAIRHLLLTNDGWVYRSSSLTPRDELKKIMEINQTGDKK